MKKSLLFASLMALGASSAFAVTDGQTYEVVNGLECKSMWVARSGGGSFGEWNNIWNTLPFNGSNNARTACIAPLPEGDRIIVSWHDMNADGNPYLAKISVFNLFTGELLRTVGLTIDGVQLDRQLGAIQIGCDDFNNVWVCGINFTPYDAVKGVANPFIVYSVDTTTGALTEAFRVELPADEKDANGRCDYMSVSGDITRQEADCTFMACTTNAYLPFVYGWKAAMGTDEFGPLMDGESFVSLPIETTYPADQASWGAGATIRIVKDEDFSAAMFYTDGFVTVPTLYDNAGGLVESFESATELSPKTGNNGVSEFTINGESFVFYAREQYDAGSTCRASICKLGEGMTFTGMQKYWDVPADGLGTTSDGGARYHAVESRVYESADGSGVEGAYVLTYKGRNGIAVYTVAPQEWDNPNDAGVNDIIADDNSNAPVEYFNLNGQAVQNDNLAPGLYITRQGNKTSKVVVK